MNTALIDNARIAAGPGEIYRALTDPAALRVWLAEHAEVSLPDHRFEFWGRYTPQGVPGRQHLVEADPDRLLRFTWKLDDVETTTTITLRPDGPSSSLLSLEQSGLPSMEELMAPAGRRDGLHSLHTFWPLAIANLAEYVEGRELTPRCDFSDDRPLSIRATITLDATPAEVFTSLTDTGRIARWFGWEVELEPRLGGRVVFGADAEITDFEPGRLLVFADKQGMVTRWELAGSGGKTRLTFVQSGFADDERDNLAQHEAGWFGALAELKRMHTLGDTWTPLTTPHDDDRE
ncbi:SRPBCC family protein [Nocardia wallacei]|uniref:SRPBCC family protein n=1 Tax=Nocardia wallacei TaxID=480035 RepID=UPI002457F1C1|nr:SRPBCC family protein [Nocardia wallacei]